MIVLSQYGEIVDCRLVRDKETGKSKGFAFICYEDQRSSILAVDNLNGSNVCGRILRVDHVEQFKIPREYFEINDEDPDDKNLYKPTGPDGRGWGKDRILSPDDEDYFNNLKKEEEEKIIKNNAVVSDDNRNYLIDNDERWEIEFEKLIRQEKDGDYEADEKEKVKKKLKKEKKLLRKQMKKEKKEEKRIKKEQELRQYYASYGITNFTESKPNIQYIPDFVPNNKPEDDDF